MSPPVPETAEDAERLAREWVDTIGLESLEDYANDIFMIATVELPRHKPALAWIAITRALEIADDAQAGMIGAGALENLLSWHGAEYLPRAEELALTSPRFGIALDNVWQFEMPDEQWYRLQAFRNAYRRRGGAA